MSKKEKIKIAIIDDDEDDFFLISDCIKQIEDKEFIIDWCKDYDMAFHQMRLKSYDIYFVDYFLGGKTGLDLLQAATAIKFDRPVVLLTGFGSRDIDIKAMQFGATDYLVKSEMSFEKMERCIRYALDRTRFLDQIKAREAKYYALFEGSKDAVFIADNRLIFSEVNHATLTLLEPGGGTLTDRSLFDFITDKVQTARIKDLVKSAGKIDDLEIKLNKDNGEVRICLLSLNIIPQKETDIVVHGIIHDITPLRKSEESRVFSEKMQANERLVRTLAHEIRNPLNNILLAVEMLMPEISQPNQKNLVTIMERNLLRINHIISELLGLTNQGELILEKWSLQDILDESLNRAADRMQLQKIQVEKNFLFEPVMIMADKNKLVLAFTNILINAVEAMEAEKGRLTLDMRSNNGVHTAIIKDNGKGIPQEYLSKLFEPLFTLKKKGTGLGLTASYSIIEAHKATLHVESVEGQGTGFFVSFKENGTGR